MDTCAEERFGRHAVKLAAIGSSAILALVAGAAVYALDRDWASTLFLSHFAGLQAGRIGFFGLLGGNLPSFFHAYAFALLLIILLGRSPHARQMGAALWFLAAVTLECLQAEQVKAVLGGAVSLADQPAYLASINAYIENGHFDPGDVAAAALGCLAAWAISFILEDKS